jgi:hypothetical protein
VTTTTTGARRCGRRHGAVLLGALAAIVVVGLAAPPSTGRAEASSADLFEPRAAAGLGPLVRHSGLETAALRHAQAMADSSVLSHMSEAMATSFITEPLTRVAQNAGVGASPEDVESKMMASNQHRANILGDFDLVGTGRATSADGRVWVAQVFAKLAGGNATSAAPLPPPPPQPLAVPVPPAAAAIVPAPAVAPAPAAVRPRPAAPARPVVASPIVRPPTHAPPAAVVQRRALTIRSSLWWRAAIKGRVLASRS